MYELVKKILDRAERENVTVDVGYDMTANEEGYSEELKAARDLILDNYEAVTALRAKGKEADIKIICNMQEAGNINGVKDYVRYLKL